MMRLVLIALFAGFIVGSVPAEVKACPLCKEAIANADEEENPSGANLPAAYNNSIYLMVGMPYLLLGTFGFLVYRGLKQNAKYLEERAAFQNGNQPLK